MFRIVSESLSLLLCIFALAMSQSPSIKIFPDSIPLYLQQYDRAINSFKIANSGSDTLSYSLLARYGKKAIEGQNTYLLGASNQIADSMVRGTILQATENLYVSEFGYGFESASPVHIEFFVFEADSETGRYRKIFSRTQQFDSVSRETWPSSGNIDVEIDSGKYCIVGVSWDNPLTFVAGTSSCCGNEGPSMLYKGSFIQAYSYPSDTAYSILSIPNYHVTYDMSLTVYFPLFIHILSSSSGYLPPAETTIVKFEAQTGSHTGDNLLSYIDVLSNDPTDSLAHVIVILPLITDVRASSNPARPTDFILNQNYPNPFNPSTTIGYNLPRQSHVVLKVYNILGQEVRTLVNEVQTAENKSLRFDSRNLPSGVYFYRLNAGTFTESKKMIIMK